MLQKPKKVWQKLSAKQKEEILTELIHICREITHENNKINKKTNNNTHSNYPTTMSSNNQS